MCGYCLRLSTFVSSRRYYNDVYVCLSSATNIHPFIEYYPFIGYKENLSMLSTACIFSKLNKCKLDHSFFNKATIPHSRSIELLIYPCPHLPCHLPPVNAKMFRKLARVAWAMQRNNQILTTNPKQLDISFSSPSSLLLSRGSSSK